MIKILNKVSTEEWIQQRQTSLCASNDDSVLTSRVREAIETVRLERDKGLRSLAHRFGDNPRPNFRLDQAEIDSAIASLDSKTKATIDIAANRIRKFAQAVCENARPVQLQDQGFAVGLKWAPVERVGCYVPGGVVPLPSTALMTAITARAAGVPTICIACPSMRPEIIYAGSLAGVTEFYEIGGSQAIAALAIGTETIKAADMVVGPGNAYVTEAKRQLNNIIGIDMLAGPSEVAIIADAEANPRWVALDLLSQAEHAPDACAFLITTSPEFAAQVRREVIACVDSEKVPPFIDDSLNNCAIFVLDDMDACVSLVNLIAPEHLQLQLKDPSIVRSKLKNYGCLFVGYQSTVPFGDYMAGPNHTLPTGSTARFNGSLNPFTFLRAQTWVEVADPTILASQTADFATIEKLHIHAAAASARTKAKVTS